jgi:hypothetical protein
LKADLSQENVVVDGADRTAIRAELGRLGLEPVGDGPFTVPVDGRGTHATLKAIQTPLTLVRTESPSLEDAYLAIVARAEKTTDE